MLSETDEKVDGINPSNIPICLLLILNNERGDRREIYSYRVQDTSSKLMTKL